MTRKSIVLGIDGGGTKTRCLVADQEGGAPLGEGLAGPSNAQVVGTQQAAANVREAAERALSAAGLARADLAAVCAGFAGVGRPEDQAAMEAALAFFHPARLQVVTDARIALAGALAGRPGVVVISGTGSIAYGIDHRGASFRAGGWGWILGDEGSGYDIGRRAVSAALAGLDGTGPATILQERICSAWGLERLDQVVGRVYGDLIAAKGQMAALVPLVLAAAADGDPVAVGLLREAGRSLGLLAAAVVRRMALPLSTPPLVAMAGGVLSGVGEVQEAMRAALAEHASAARLVESAGSPADGAILLARELLIGY